MYIHIHIDMYMNMQLYIYICILNRNYNISDSQYWEYSFWEQLLVPESAVRHVYVSIQSYVLLWGLYCFPKDVRI